MTLDAQFSGANVVLCLSWKHACFRPRSNLMFKIDVRQQFLVSEIMFLLPLGFAFSMLLLCHSIQNICQ